MGLKWCGKLLRMHYHWATFEPPFPPSNYLSWHSSTWVVLRRLLLLIDQLVYLFIFKEETFFILQNMQIQMYNGRTFTEDDIGMSKHASSTRVEIKLLTYFCKMKNFVFFSKIAVTLLFYDLFIYFWIL